VNCVLCGKKDPGFPQWCEICGRPHQDAVELTHSCKVAAMCRGCAIWDHDCNADPGMTTSRATDPLEPTPCWPVEMF
jgi:hypothetical protein